MNREIKFRAWSVGGMRDMGELVMDHAIDCHNANNGIVLLQYTGLKDKNGREIYEGDIVKVEIDQLFETVEKTGHIEYGDGMWMIDFLSDGVAIHTNGVQEMEVIGNIYENPELIKS